MGHRGLGAPAPYKKRRHLDGGMRHDPGWALVSAPWKSSTKTPAKPAKPPSSPPTCSPPPRSATTADSPEEALAMSLDRSSASTSTSSPHYSKSPAVDARELIAGLVYPSLDDPDELVPAVNALSGNVRQKLAAATRGRPTNPVYNDYVNALREVMPADRDAEEIKARPGAPWIPAAVVAQFAETHLRAYRVTAEHIAGRWVVEVAPYKRHCRAHDRNLGDGPHAAATPSACLTRCAIRDSVVVNNDQGVLDTQATFAAQAKRPKSAKNSAGGYSPTPPAATPSSPNTTADSTRCAPPPTTASQLRLPGLSDHFTPHLYQRNAVARIIAEPTTLLDHCVGAGKRRLNDHVRHGTPAPRAGAPTMDRRTQPHHRTSRARSQTMVPRRQQSSWGRRPPPPTAAAASSPNPRPATGTWSSCRNRRSPRSASSDRVREDYIRRQIDTLREQLETPKTDRTKKRIELAIKSTVERLERLTSQQAKDTGLRFENTGADYLFVDEAHMLQKPDSASATSKNCPAPPHRSAPRTSRSNSTCCASAAATKPAPPASPNTASSNGSPPSPPAHPSPTRWGSCGSCKPTCAPTC